MDGWDVLEVADLLIVLQLGHGVGAELVGGAHRIRLISSDGIVSTIAGSGVAGYADGSGTEAAFWYPTDIAIGRDGRLYVADWKNHRIRSIFH